MATYIEIKKAYEASCEAAWALKDSIHQASMMLNRAIFQVGEFPENTTFCYPPDKTSIDRKTKYSPSGATVFNEEDVCWEFGHFMEIGYKDAVFPKDLFKSVFQIRPIKDQITISLKNCEITMTVDMDEIENEEQKFMDFASASLDVLREHYLSRPDVWVNESKERVIGFNQ